MIIKFGPTIVGARGTIGGIIFTANKAGPFARIWSKGANPRTALQSNQRGRLGSLATNWRTLTAAQQLDWDDYADDPAQVLKNSLGLDYFISGFNWYVRINTQLEIAGAARRVDAPTLTRPIAPTIEFIRNRGTDFGALNYVRYGVADPDLGELHVIFARLVYSQGINPIPPHMPYMITGIPDGGRLLVFTTEYADTFGNNPATARCLVSTRVQDAHGQRGPAATALKDTQVA